MMRATILPALALALLCIVGSVVVGIASEPTPTEARHD